MTWFEQNRDKWITLHALAACESGFPPGSTHLLSELRRCRYITNSNIVTAKGLEFLAATRQEIQDFHRRSSNGNVNRQSSASDVRDQSSSQESSQA